MRLQSYVEAMRVCLEEESVEEDSSPAGLRLARLVHEIVRATAFLRTVWTGLVWFVLS